MTWLRHIALGERLTGTPSDAGDKMKRLRRTGGWPGIDGSSRVVAKSTAETTAPKRRDRCYF